jgi:hypothetical protein
MLTKGFLFMRKFANISCDVPLFVERIDFTWRLLPEAIALLLG